jgi:hypothetical protein
MILLVGLYVTPVPAVRNSAIKEESAAAKSSDGGKKNLRKVE